ncbi:MAG: hydrolase TatD, partial [Tissierellia bacterium]|nr:hydrolase TatD [Tissierellia bacterium]
MIDSHAHLDHSAFDEDRNEVIDNLKRDGVDLVFNVGSSIKSSRNCIALAEKYENIYAVVGVHPADILGLDDKAISELKEMAMHEKVVAIGEIGLDYYYEDNPPRELQIEAFKRQLDLACELDMPVAI